MIVSIRYSRNGEQSGFDKRLYFLDIIIGFLAFLDRIRSLVRRKNVRFPVWSPKIRTETGDYSASQIAIITVKTGSSIYPYNGLYHCIVAKGPPRAKTHTVNESNDIPSWLAFLTF